MLYAPFVIGVAATMDRFSWRTVPFLLGMTAAFFAHEPLVTVLRLDPSRPQNQEKRKQLAFWLIVFLSIAAVSIVPLVIIDHLWYLLVLGGATGLLLLFHGYLVSELSQRSFAAEFLGVICLTSSSAAARYVLLGRLDRMAFMLWVLNILYFSSSIFYVKMRVSRYAKKPEARSLTLQCAVYHILLLVCLIFFVLHEDGSILAAMAFAPIMIRTFYAMIAPAGKLNLKRIGIAEIAYTLVFVALLSIAMTALKD